MHVMMPNSFAEDITPAAGGAPYRIFVYRPATPAPASGWPLLCMTDGNAVFGTAADALRAQVCWPSGTDVEDGVVVAIGYPSEEAYDSVRRSWDLSPPPGTSYPPFTADGPPVRTGGGEHFLRFIAEDLLPWIGAQAPIDPRRTSLFGHSFGGLFTLMALFTRPALFRTYFAVSPALYWEDAALRPAEDAFFAGPLDRHDLRLHLSAGAFEGEELAPFYKGRPDEANRRAHQDAIGTIARAEALAARVRTSGAPRFRAQFEVFPGENHMSVLPVAVSRAVQTAFSLSWASL